MGVRARPRRLLAAAVVVLVALGALVLVLQSGGGTEPRWFDRDSVWNAPLDADAPLHPDSDRLTARLQREVATQQAKRYGPWINIHEFSTPVYEVGPDQATVEVRDAPGDEVFPPAMAEAFKEVPIPADARPAAGTDGHMVIWQPSTDTLWEFWVAVKGADGWTARWGGRMENVSESPGYFQGEQRDWGATATSLPLVGGLVTLEDVQAGVIDHALAMAIPDGKYDAVAWPAQRTDGQDIAADAIPEGTRFRLDPELDLAALRLPRLTHMLAEAAQRYGIVVRDKAVSVVAFFGEDPAGGEDPFAPLLKGREVVDITGAFPWDHLQALAVPDGET
jgi:hypothetical protein